MSFISGPTSVPYRVRTASTAIARWSIRRMTLSSWSASGSLAALLSQSASLLMKNVVLPESPYGVCTTRSPPRPCRLASSVSSW